MHKATGFALAEDHKSLWGQEKTCHQTWRTSIEGSNVDENQGEGWGESSEKNRLTQIF